MEDTRLRKLTHALRGLDSDHLSEILPAAQGTLEGLNTLTAGVHVLLNDGPFRVAAGSHILNDSIEINSAGAEFAEYTTPYRFKKANPISTSGFQDQKLYILQMEMPNACAVQTH